MRMPFSRWPWLPARTLYLFGGGFLAFLLIVVVPLTVLNLRESMAIDSLKESIRVQSILRPLLADFEAAARNTGALVGDTAELPRPAGLAALVESLQKLAAASGLQNAAFVPIAETIVASKDRIRIDGTLSGSPDSLRRFLLLLSNQGWIHGLTYVNAAPAGGVSAYELGVWASFGQQNGGGRP